MAQAPGFEPGPRGLESPVLPITPRLHKLWTGWESNPHLPPCKGGAQPLGELFPYRVIPHAVLINANGEVVAITAPENITAVVIEKVLRGESIDLPVKISKQDFDPLYDYFQADTLTQASFDLQPNNPDLPSFTKQYGEGPFKGRRFTAYNQTIEGLYRDAYQIDFSFDPENPDTFRTAMKKLGLKYAKAQREIEVLVLYLEE